MNNIFVVNSATLELHMLAYVMHMLAMLYKGTSAHIKAAFVKDDRINWVFASYNL